MKQPRYYLSRWLFLRIVGLCYLSAFLSLWLQVDGLYGSEGILSIKHYLASASTTLGLRAYHLIPTLFWLNASDFSLHLLCTIGTICATALVLGYWPLQMLLVLWVGYLSFVTTGQAFLSFQWDNLLLETGFIALFLASSEKRPPIVSANAPRKEAIFLVWWLLFRLMIASGAVKILSGDPTWANLSALNYHFETQPLPTVLGYYAHQLPHFFHYLATVIMFGIELLAPLLIFVPGFLRLFAAILFFSLQVLILLTGNYAFFNLLTIGLSIMLLDDSRLLRFFPQAIRAELLTADPREPSARQRWFLQSAAALCFILSGLSFIQGLTSPNFLPSSLQTGINLVSPLRTFNHYGLFAVMTTERPEIILEGSNDNINWVAYDLRWKPGRLNEAPHLVAPYQPRLDWQMWFAALGEPSGNRWIENFAVRLLQGRKSVVGLLAEDPFNGSPPRYIRATRYRYRFTTLAEKRKTGEWWKREEIGPYLPALSLRHDPR